MQVSEQDPVRVMTSEPMIGGAPHSQCRFSDSGRSLKEEDLMRILQGGEDPLYVAVAADERSASGGQLRKWHTNIGTHQRY